MTHRPPPVHDTTGLLADVGWDSFVFASPRYLPSDSYLDIAADKLRRAGVGLGLGEADAEPMFALVTELCTPWGKESVGEHPGHPSYFASDGMPFELSAAWDRHGAELRMSFEVPGEFPTLRSKQAVGAALTRGLAAHPQVSIDRYLAVADLFLPPDPVGPFAMLHGVSWRPGTDPLLKVYLNPQCRGAEQASSTVAEAMARLGMASAWHALLNQLGESGVPTCFSLDLSRSPQARVKVYFGHPHADDAEIDRCARVARSHRPEAFAEMLRTVSAGGRHEWSRPPGTCFAFHSGSEVPSSVALYLTLRSRFDNDLAVSELLTGLLRREGIDPMSYLSLAKSVQDGPPRLTTTQYCLAYHGGPVPRIAVYLAPGIYTAG